MLYRQEMDFSVFIQICCIKFGQVGLKKEVNLFHRRSLLASEPRRPMGRRFKSRIFLTALACLLFVKQFHLKIMIKVWHLENYS